MVTQPTLTWIQRHCAWLHSVGGSRFCRLSMTESALPLSFLRCRFVHKNMVGDGIPGVMNAYEK